MALGIASEAATRRNRMTKAVVFPQLGAGGVRVERLVPEDRPRVAELCRRTTDFFELVEGHPASEASAAEVLEVAPPGVLATNKFVLGLRREGVLVGLVDLVDGYPAPGTWYVGLLLLDPAERGRGLGTLIWSELEAHIRHNGGHTVGLIVQNQNPGARRFWEARGFMVDGEVEQILPHITNRVWRLRKDVAVPVGHFATRYGPARRDLRLAQRPPGTPPR